MRKTMENVTREGRRGPQRARRRGREHLVKGAQAIRGKGKRRPHRVEDSQVLSLRQERTHLPSARVGGPMTKPKIAVLGTGDVGQRLASGFASKGYEVMMGSRTPDKEEVRAWLKGAPAGCAAGTLVQAAKFGDIVVLAVSGDGAKDALMLAGHENLRGKVVLDVTNPLAHAPQGPSLTVGFTDSLGEQIQRWVPEARVVKTLNIISNGMMVDPPRLEGLTPDMLLCGNDEEAKKTAMVLLRDLGWPKESLIDLGGIESSRLLEPLAMLWIAYGFRNNHWTHAFKLVGR